MAPSVMPRKRKGPDSLQAIRPSKKSKKQLEYHSSSDEHEEDDDEPSDFQAVNLADSEEDDDEDRTSQKKEKKSIGSQNGKGKQDERDGRSSDDDEVEESEEEEEEDQEADQDDSDSDRSLRNPNSKSERRIPKRNDPAAFSTSISKILTTKLPASARSDPVLSRSKSAADVRLDFASERLDRLARAKLRADKREELDRGRIRDVMGIARQQAGHVAEEEKRLCKTAQRGVIKLFNAVRVAQVRGEEAARAEKRKGTIGLDERAKTANEISKQGFLELIGGKKGKQVHIEEA